MPTSSRLIALIVGFGERSGKNQSRPSEEPTCRWCQKYRTGFLPSNAVRVCNPPHTLNLGTDDYRCTINYTFPPFLCSHTLIHYESMLCWYTGEPRWTPWVTLPLGQGQQGARNAGAPKCVCPYLSLCAWNGKLAEITKDEAAVAAEDEGWRVRDGAGAGAAAAVTGGAWRWRTVADDMMTVKTMMRHDGRDQHDQWSDVNRHTRWRLEHGWTHFKPLQLGLELRPSSVCSTRLCTPSTSSAATRREISLLPCRHIGVQVGIRPTRPPTCSWIEMLREGYVFFFRGRFRIFFGGFLVLCFPASLLFCFCASVPFYVYYSTFSSVMCFAALLPAPLLLCFLSLLPLCFFSFLLLYCLLFVS